jgi:hypothetical protein
MLYYLPMKHSGLSFLAFLLLTACNSQQVAFTVFTLPSKELSIEYPADWYIEDIHEMSNLVAFFPHEPKPEESVEFLDVWIVPKNLYPSLQAFANSQRSDEEEQCDQPVAATIGNKRYEGLVMLCASRNAYSFLEGTDSYFSIVFPQGSANEKAFARMRDSVVVATR